METSWVLTLLFIVILSVVLLGTRYTHSEMFVSFDDINPVALLRREAIQWIPLVEAGNEIATQWLLNIGWVWKFGDQIVDFQRARNGLPPMKRITVDPKNFSINVQANPKSMLFV